jgi:hypothetical protein
MTTPMPTAGRSSGAKKVGLQFLRIGVGFGTVMLGGIAVAGTGFLTVLVMSIICTLGVSLLVFWIPIWWVVGFMLLALYDVVRRRRQGAAAASTDPFKLAGVDFIRQSRAVGLKDDAIRGHLLVGGWTEAQVNDVMTLAK